MSVAIPLSWIPRELAVKITSEELHFVKKQGFTPGYSWSVPEPESVDLFRSEGSTVYLPYNYTIGLVHQGLLPASVLKPIPKNPTREAPTFFSFTANLFESQIPMVNTAYSQLMTHGTTTLNVYTGAGKTVMVAYLLACLSMLNQVAIIFMTNTTLISQWKDTFSKFTKATVWVVGEAFPDKPVNVIICMDGRFKKLPPAFVSQIGTVVYDEAHTFCTEGRKSCLLGLTPTFVIAASATMHRPDDMISLMYAVVGEHAVKEISQKPFQIYKYNTGITIPIVKNTMGKVDYSKVIAAQVESEERNGLIYDLVEQHRNDKILVMCKYIKHVNTIYDELTKRGKSVDHMSGNKKKYKDSHVLVGTINKIGTGFDEKAACEDFNGFRINVLILTCSIKSLGLLEQVVGRAFRSDAPQVYYLIDHNSIVQNHWRGAVNWFKSRNGIIKEIDSPYERERKSKERKGNAKAANMHQAIIQANLEAARKQMGGLKIGTNVTFHHIDLEAPVLGRDN